MLLWEVVFNTGLTAYKTIWLWICLTLYSIDTHFYVCCSRQHLKTLWQRKKLLLQDCCVGERVKMLWLFSTDEVLVPTSLQCGGFQDNLQEAVLWFSSGNTKSVLHYDTVDNINCLLDGEKKLVLIDKVCKHFVLFAPL